MRHNIQKYGGVPIWAVCELWEFGTLSRIFALMQKTDQDAIARQYSLPSGSHLASHLYAFNSIRNIAAHHARLWNRRQVGRPRLKGIREAAKKDEILWTLLDPNSIFATFCLMQRMLRYICPHSKWGKRFLDVLNTFPKLDYDAPEVRLRAFGISNEIASHKGIQKWKLWDID